MKEMKRKMGIVKNPTTALDAMYCSVVQYGSSVNTAISIPPTIPTIGQR
jgi:hypothetical protein